MTFGTNSRLVEGITISDKHAMSIMARWYLENIYPLLPEALDGFTDSEEDKISGFGFWMFNPEHNFIQLTNWQYTRAVEFWELRVSRAMEDIRLGATFNSVMVY
jgi:hypothetical protein